MAVAILKKMLIDDAVHWPNVRSDGRGGRTSDAPVQLRVRWEDSDELITDAAGKETKAKAKVFVDTDFSGTIVPGDYLFRGKLTDLPTNDLGDVDDAQEIRQYNELPTLKGDQNLRTAWL